MKLKTWNVPFSLFPAYVGIALMCLYDSLPWMHWKAMKYMWKWQRLYQTHMICCFHIKRWAAGCVYSIQGISPEEIWKEAAYGEGKEQRCIPAVTIKNTLLKLVTGQDKSHNIWDGADVRTERKTTDCYLLWLSPQLSASCVDSLRQGL